LRRLGGIAVTEGIREQHRALDAGVVEHADHHARVDGLLALRDIAGIQQVLVVIDARRRRHRRLRQRPRPRIRAPSAPAWRTATDAPRLVQHVVRRQHQQ
jgi:hypothetical protein